MDKAVILARSDTVSERSHLAGRPSAVWSQKILDGTSRSAAVLDQSRGDDAYLLNAAVLVKVLGQTPERVISRWPTFCATTDEQR